MDGKRKNPHPINVQCGFRTVSNTYPRNDYTLAAISALVYVLIIPYHAIPYHTIPYHTINFTMPYYTINFTIPCQYEIQYLSLKVLIVLTLVSL